MDADDQHIVSIVDWLMQYAFTQRASDIHIEPRRNQGNVRFRIDGVMHQVYEIPANITAAVGALPPIVLAIVTGFLVVKLIQRYVAVRRPPRRHP